MLFFLRVCSVHEQRDFILLPVLDAFAMRHGNISHVSVALESEVNHFVAFLTTSLSQHFYVVFASCMYLQFMTFFLSVLSMDAYLSTLTDMYLLS